MGIDITLLERLADPVLLVGDGDLTLFGNRAWHELATRHAVAPRLAALFGPAVGPLLAEARRGGQARAFLPLATPGDDTRGFRITVSAGSEDGTLAVQLTDLSEEVAWRQQLFLRNNELAALNDSGTALAGTIEVDTLAQRIWDQVGRLMENASGFVALHAGEQAPPEIRLQVEDGAVVAADRPRPFAVALAAHVLRDRQPLLLNGDVRDALAGLGLGAPEHACASLVAVPIQSEGDALGVLALLDHDQSGRYGRHELGILGIVATQAATAIRTARMFEAMRSAFDELTSTQARLLESERLRGVTETVGALNHEVNNPLATIVGTAQLVLRRGDLDEATRTRIERMLEAARRIQTVTARMATLIQATSRPYPGRTQILDLTRSVAREDTADPAAPAPPRRDASAA